MSFNVFHDEPPTPDPPGAPAAMAEARRRRARQRALVGAAASLLLVIVAAVALRSPDDGRPVVANQPSDAPSTAPTASLDATTSTSTSTSTIQSTTAHRGATATSAPPATTTTTTYGQGWVSHSGTANLTFSGVQSGSLAGAVASCNPRPGASSDLQVNGTLNGTPWVLYVQSYTGEMGGAYQVITGEAGGGTGMVGSGYSAHEDYPKTLAGVTNVDWAHGATLDIDLTSGDGQTPAGTVHVSGTISCS